jgi:flagellar basal-body rod protein FlgB
MNDLLNPFGVHEQALGLRTRRLELIASNIANADTPRFKSRDIDFKALIASAQQSLLKTTNTKHFAAGDQNAAGISLKYRVPFNASADGNTVEMSVEQAAYGKAAADYRATLNFIDGETSSIRRALRGE